VDTKEYDERIVKASEEMLTTMYYSPLIKEGSYLVSRIQRQIPSGLDIGDIRISFKEVKCGPATIVAQ
jgi:hypothetical protein